MKSLISIFFVFFALSASSQQYFTTSGKTHFFSSTPLEDIEAINLKSVCAFNTETSKVSANIPVKSFKFRDELMEAHFNENYLESDKYPNAKLTGTLKAPVDYSKDGTVEVVVLGKLEIHGVTVEREIPCKLTIKDGAPSKVTSEFDVVLSDHKIKIPKALFTNIAEVIKVDLSYDLVKYTK